ncbi:MAG TPA: WG repeat-containing protein, partial [Chitinophagales bacterium]|nr:WG repeat-containing protein [Chitinophagales bacterium]
GLALAGTSKEENLQLSFIDHSGKVVIPVPYKIINPRFINGLTYFGIEKNGTRKYGFIDRTGKTIIEPVYDKVEEIISSSAKDLGKVIAFKVKSGELWGLISSDIVIKPAFSEIAAFREGLASASTGTGEQQKYGFIDTKGNWIIQPLYDEVNDFAYGLASVRIGGMLDGKWGYIDTNGKMVIEPQFRYAYNFLGNIALVQRGNGKAIIDRTGKVLVEE